ncbi:hypothetical protein BJY52DRAFT_1421150 [Lactarius psammicola]|nr:hypothetical protein BJY52DRAFT_1421150 [Lactarius psammicola]
MSFLSLPGWNLHPLFLLQCYRSVTLWGVHVLVEAAVQTKRETNGQRFAKGLPPLPPVRRSPTETAKRRQFSLLPSPLPVVGELPGERCTSKEIISAPEDSRKVVMKGWNGLEGTAPFYISRRVISPAGGGTDFR